ncbi:MAG: hypothetical protein AB7V18_12115 [Pyrinomonadaceae bacterium]
MSLIIPERAYMKLRAAKPIAVQLTNAVNKGKNTWTAEQQEQLSLIYQVIKETHDALVNIVEANTPK